MNSIERRLEHYVMSSGDMLDVSSSRCSCIRRRCDFASVFALENMLSLHAMENEEKENEGKNVSQPL